MSKFPTRGRSWIARAAMAGPILAASLALAAHPAAAEPALWKVEGPHATVYLFGTVHVLKKDTQWRSAKLEAAFKASSTLWEEIKDADDPAAMQPLVMKYGVDPGHPLHSKLDDAGKAELDATSAALGLQPAQIDPLRPWLAALTFTVLPLVKAGYDPKSGVDVLLKADAAAQNKPLQAFETTEQQVRFFADLPLNTEVQYLMATLDEAGKGTAEFDQLVDAWAAGDLPKMETILNGDLRDKYPKLYKLLLVDRNQRFAEQIKSLLQGQDTVFVAVGAAHLAGPDSVQADLAKMGIRAVRQ